MTEAHVKRDVERQDFLDQLKRQIYEEEEETHDRMQMQAPFAIAIVAHLASRGRTKLPFAIDSPAATFFEGAILPQINEFARTPEEEGALVAELLQWEANSIANSFRSALQTQEIHEPGRLFEGRQAMDEAAP